MNADQFTTSDQKFRQPTSREKSILKFLLTKKFKGCNTLRRQISDCLVRTLDENASLKLKTLCKDKANVERRIPTEAEMLDTDKITVHILLHVVNGKVDELEFYKDDLSRILGSVDLSKVKIVDPYATQQNLTKNKI